MHKDKIFAAYAMTLVLSLLTVLTGMIYLGVAELPPALVFAEHLVLGLAMRASYKSFGGFDWAEWSLLSDRPESLPEAPEAPAGGLGASSA